MTILGKHTVTETRDLMKVVDYRVKELDKGFNAISADYKVQHAPEYDLLAKDWNALKVSWENDVNRVSKSLILRNSLSPLSPNMIAAEDEYRIILGYVEYGASSGTERKPGDLRDCNDRIDKALGTPVNLNNRPDISKSGDADMDAIRKLDASIAAAKAAANKAGDVVKDAAKSNIGLIVIGSLVLVGAGIVAVKVYL